MTKLECIPSPLAAKEQDRPHQERGICDPTHNVGLRTSRALGSQRWMKEKSNGFVRSVE